jgi:hypothetical protein
MLQIGDKVECLTDNGVCGWQPGDIGRIVETPDKFHAYYRVVIDRIGTDVWSYSGDMLRKIDRVKIDLDYVRIGKVQAIKTLRDIVKLGNSLGLKDAKDFIEAVMSIKSYHDTNDAVTIRDMTDKISHMSESNTHMRDRIDDLVTENDTLRTKLRAMYDSMDHFTLVELLLK